MNLDAGLRWASSEGRVVGGSTNWAGNHVYRATELATPTTIGEVQGLVAAAGQVRALGSRHSFNDIADSPQLQISLERMPADLELDTQRRTVRFSAGTRFGVVAEYLNARGLALHNLASLPHISVAGAVATATHGSGDRNGNLATKVVELEIVTASGDLVTMSRESEPEFDGAVVSLGALGIVTRLTLEVEPAFEVEQRVFERLPWEALLGDFDAITGSAYSVSVFTTWRSDWADQVWLKQRTGAGASAAEEFYGATPAEGPRHILPGLPAENCTEQGGVPGAWHDRLPHFKMGFTPSNGAELQSEYLVPRQHATAAISELKRLRPLIGPLLQVAEIRTVAADGLWLSSAYGRDTVGFHFTWKPLQARVEAVLPELERALAPFDPRPHWGKLFVMDRSGLERAFPRMDDFRSLARRYDPSGKFTNGFLSALVFA